MVWLESSDIWSKQEKKKAHNFQTIINAHLKEIQIVSLLKWYCINLHGLSLSHRSDNNVDDDLVAHFVDCPFGFCWQRACFSIVPFRFWKLVTFLKITCFSIVSSIHHCWFAKWAFVHFILMLLRLIVSVVFSLVIVLLSFFCPF